VRIIVATNWQPKSTTWSEGQQPPTAAELPQWPHQDNSLYTVLHISIITIKLCPRGAQTCALPLQCKFDLKINRMTLKLKGDLDKDVSSHWKWKWSSSLRHSKLAAWIKKIIMFQGQRSRSKCQNVWITSSIAVTEIPIKPQQFPTSRFWVAHYRFFIAMTLT